MKPTLGVTLKTLMSVYFMTAMVMASWSCLPVAAAAERPSLKTLATKFQRGPEITQAFTQGIASLPKAAGIAASKAASKPGLPLNGFLQENQALRAEFFSAVKASSAFVRGEIEDEKILNFITNFLQLSILKIRSDLASGKSAAVSDEVQVWFNFAADLSYEESSLVGLRLANLIRSLLLDELEMAAQGSVLVISESGNWLRTLRAPWPVDRVFLFESKRVLKPRSLAVAEKVAQAFQKNPYQTAEQILKKTPGGAGADLEFLKSIWRDSDLTAMKTEVNRLGLLRARAADLHFEIVKKQKASGWEDLKKVGGLDQVPVDYFTGRPMEWAQLVATRAGTPQTF